MILRYGESIAYSSDWPKCGSLTTRVGLVGIEDVLITLRWQFTSREFPWRGSCPCVPGVTRADGTFRKDFGQQQTA